MVFLSRRDRVRPRNYTDAGKTTIYYWPTGFGHGIGTNIAALPNLHWKSETVLQPGHIFALERMIVIQGFGCGAMEDQILITEKGARSLTPAKYNKYKVW